MAVSNPPFLTKGCFVHKIAYNKKRKYSNKTRDEMPHKMLHDKLWERMEKEIKTIEKGAHKQTVENIVQFIRDSQERKSRVIKEIPTAVLILGVNMPDHSNIFQYLESQIQISETPGTVILQSKDCGNISNMMERTISGVINKFQKIMGLDNIPLKKYEYTFKKLLTWYEENKSKIRTSSSPKKSPAKKSKKGKDTVEKLNPIVILIQDVEAFNSEVLQMFILNCRLYIGKLPIVFVFGIASAMVTLHSILNWKALSCLGTETFYSLAPTEYLTKILQKVIMSPDQPFKLGPHVFKLIVDTVLYHDFSVANLTNMLKFCMFEHFYSNQLTFLCCDQAELKESAKKLQSQHIQILMKLPSFENYIENNPECKIQVKNEADIKGSVVQHLLKLHSYHKFMNILLCCLHSVSKDLPGYPLGKQLRELYSLALEKEIVCSSNYIQTAKLLGMYSSDELEERLKECLQILKDAAIKPLNDVLIEAKEKLQGYIDKLNEIKQEGESEEEEAPPPPVFFTSKVMSRSQLQQELLTRVKKKKHSKFELCRQNIVEYFTSLFSNIIPPSKMPFYEVLYFDSASVVKKHLMASPMSSIHRALLNPQAYLKCHCCELNDNAEISSTMPDLSIIYKLHTEYGKLINLYDWLEAFKAVKQSREPSKPKRRTEAKDGEEVSELEIRFVQAVSELQLLGLIKSTKKKTDHVARLTFGSL